VSVKELSSTVHSRAGTGIKRRIEALRRHHNIADDQHVPLYIIPGQANLVADHALLVAEIAEQLE
jgi:hypothetical protein